MHQIKKKSWYTSRGFGVSVCTIQVPGTYGIDREMIRGNKKGLTQEMNKAKTNEAAKVVHESRQICMHMMI